MSSFNKRVISKDRELLLDWFGQNQRDLPWRKNKDPYRVWLSEVMLQQTTVKAVVPYFKKFIKTFPTVNKLAAASIEEIYELWAGLGYYSRARSLHKAAKEIVELGGFPNNHQDLLKLPGLGDYTARAVSSIAFGEKVGVVDGNVIRVLSRRWNRDWQWWKTADKKEIQAVADLLADTDSPSQLNQGLMELGSTVCTPKSPTCFLCPWQKRCLGYKEDTHLDLPLKKEKRASEIWQWQPTIVFKGSKLGFVKNDYAPFLKGQLLLPGTVKQLKKAPKTFDFKHGITHHNIFVKSQIKRSLPKKEDIVWLAKSEIKQKVPFSLVHKTLELLSDSK